MIPVKVVYCVVGPAQRSSPRMVLVPHAPVRALIASGSPEWCAATAASLSPAFHIDVVNSIEDVFIALDAAGHDLVILDREVASAIAARRAGDPSATLHDALLTEQERVVLRLMRQHLTYKEIAQRLGVSWHTIRTHAQSILRKCGVHSRRDLERIPFTVLDHSVIAAVP